MLRDDRKEQATLCSILCATRFKFFSKKKELQSTICGRCGQVDSFEHLLRCVGQGPIPEDDKALPAFLAEMAIRACDGNPNLPNPITGDGEIDLDLGSDRMGTENDEARSARGSNGELEFEEDE